MRFLLSTSIFILILNAANAGPGASRMAMPEVMNSSKFIAKIYPKTGDFRMNRYNFYNTYPHIQKRTFHTKLKTDGYKPKETAVIPQRHILPWPKKVEYLDDTYEVFRTPPGFKEKLEESIKRSHTDKPFFEEVEKKK